MRFLRWILLALLAVILLWIALLIVSALLVDPKKSHLIDSPYYRWLLNTSTRVMTAVLRIRVHVIGAALVPKDQRFLLVCNHRSNFDPILTWYALRDQQLAFISKPENFHIPVFGRIILRCGFLAIDRENAKNALVTVNEAARRLKSGAMSIAVIRRGRGAKPVSCCRSITACSRSRSAPTRRSLSASSTAQSRSIAAYPGGQRMSI